MHTNMNIDYLFCPLQIILSGILYIMLHILLAMLGYANNQIM